MLRPTQPIPPPPPIATGGGTEYRFEHAAVLFHALKSGQAVSVVGGRRSVLSRAGFEILPSPIGGPLRVRKPGT